MGFAILILIALVVGGSVAFLKTYGLLLLADLVSFAAMKATLEPDDDSPRLLRLLVPGIILFSGGAALHRSTDPLIWLLGLVPAAICSIPAAKYLLRMSWLHAVFSASATLLVHAVCVLMLNYFGFNLEFDYNPRIMQ